MLLKYVYVHHIGCLCWVIVNLIWFQRVYNTHKITSFGDAIIGNCLMPRIVTPFVPFGRIVNVFTELLIFCFRTFFFSGPYWIEIYQFIFRATYSRHNALKLRQRLQYFISYWNIEIKFLATIYIFIYLFCFIESCFVLFVCMVIIYIVLWLLLQGTSQRERMRQQVNEWMSLRAFIKIVCAR